MVIYSESVAIPVHQILLFCQSHWCLKDTQKVPFGGSAVMYWVTATILPLPTDRDASYGPQGIAIKHTS